MYKCIGCDSSLHKIFSLGNQPLANKYPNAETSFDDEFSSELVVFKCPACNYSHVPCSVDRSIFFEDYYYLSSVNKELVSHFESLADYLSTTDSQFVVDVGSNDGILLRPLKERGIKCLGVDPSENVGKIANDQNLETIVSFFDPQTANRVVESHGRASTIVASSVFTHLAEPLTFFKSCDNLLDDDGIIIIEVEYLVDIIKSLGFERFYFDRPHYYTLNTISRIAEKAGFCVTDCRSISVHGGSIRVICSRLKDVNKVSPDVNQVIKKEAELLSDDSISKFFSEFQTSCIQLKNFLLTLSTQETKVFAYGCPARLSTITNFADIDRTLIPYIVDDSPLKAGRFSPGKHIPIYSKIIADDERVSMVFAYEYIESIRNKLKDFNLDFYRPIPLTKL